METIAVAVPVTAKEASEINSRTLEARMQAVALWHTSGMATLLESYDEPEPMDFAVSKDGDQLIFRVILPRPLDEADEVKLGDHLIDSPKLLFLLKGINFNSSWSNHSRYRRPIIVKTGDARNN